MDVRLCECSKKRNVAQKNGVCINFWSPFKTPQTWKNFKKQGVTRLDKYRLDTLVKISLLRYISKVLQWLPRLTDLRERGAGVGWHTSKLVTFFLMPLTQQKYFAKKGPLFCIDLLQTLVYSWVISFTYYDISDLMERGDFWRFLKILKLFQDFHQITDIVIKEITQL